MDADHWSDHQRDGLSWREAGSGPPVIFLHGLGGARMAWGPQLRELSSSFRCIAWDMPGYGHARAIRPLTYRAIAERVVDLIDAVTITDMTDTTDTTDADDTPGRADLVGLSFGGMHAMHTAINFPDRVGKLVLASTSPAFGMDGTTKDDWTRDRLASLENGGTPADGAEAILDFIAGHPLTGQVRTEAIECFHNISPEGFRGSIECLPTNDVRAQLADIVHESLIIVGDLDEETPPSYSQVIHDGLPNSRLEILADVGHLSNAEAPVRFNRLVEDFLSAPSNS